MILINFSHPITPEQQAQIEALTARRVERVIAISAQVDPMQPLGPQIERLADTVGLSAEAWQTRPILIVPPALNFSAATLIAHLHGRMGYFPPIVRLRRVPDALPPRFEVAEIINLQQIRDQAREKRTKG